VLLRWLKYQYRCLFSDQVEVFIQPHRIELLRITRSLQNRFQPRVLRQQVIDLPCADDGSDPWITVSAKLTHALKHDDWQKSSVVVILSNHFVRYTTIPWHPDLRSTAEQQAYLAHTFQLAFGDTAKHWDMRMSAAGYGKDNLASAVPMHIIQHLQFACTEAELPLTAIQPHLMRTLNQSFAQVKRMAASDRACLYHGQSKAYTCWFVAIQQDRLCLALIENGNWRLIKNILVEHDISEQVAAHLQRETINHNVTGKPVVLLNWPSLHHGQSLRLEEYAVVKILENHFPRPSLKAAPTIQKWGRV